MPLPPPPALHIFAPAKINLFLHITGKRADGYHSLDSLVTFADIGDTLTLEQAERTALEITGEHSAAFGPAERDASATSSNLIIRALRGLADITGHPPDVKITLDKYLPLSSGIGGGSADAAATLWGLLKYWDILPQSLSAMDDLLLSLGADTPVCFHCNSAQMRGIGENITPYRDFPEIPCVLVNPRKACATQDIFRALPPNYAGAVTLPPEGFGSIDRLCDFLHAQTGNDLQSTAADIIPEIKTVISAIQGIQDCKLVRMSGSGATCFGLFGDEETAKDAQRQLARDHPDWWVRFAWLNRPGRY